MIKIVIAKNKYVDKTARKVRLVADLIRGKNVNEAMSILLFTQKKAAAEPIIKTLKSAIGNATNNSGMDKNDLIVKTILVDDAPVFKRGRAISRGRYHQILKRNCHITIGLTNNKEIETNKPLEGKKIKVKTKVKKVEEKKKATKKVITKTIKNKLLK